MSELSQCQEFADALVASMGTRETALRAVDMICSKFTNVQKAALAANWSFWARPKQLLPATRWRSALFYTGRGFGKTLAISKEINKEVEADRARLICLLAQDEASSIAIQVLGPSGLIATAPPWCKPVWEASKLELVWPNGARAYVRTPEVPGKIRGLEYHLGWGTELLAWPVATRDEAHDNLVISTRLGYARTLWDTTPKRRHPVIRRRIQMAADEPEKHLLIRGTTYENAGNLGDGYVDDLERMFKGTSRWREEMNGEFLDDEEGALVKDTWIKAARRPMPDRFVRKAIGIDVAITKRAGSDRTGIVLAGSGADGQGYVLRDLTGKYTPAAWAAVVLDVCKADAVDVVVIETNKGGDLVVQNLRAAANERGLSVVVLGKSERCPTRRDGVVYVREIYSRGSKEDRAQPTATAYERGRISHVEGADLASLEETLTTWVPTPSADSPDDLDALVSAITELLDLAIEAPNPKRDFAGIEKMAKLLSPRAPSRSLSALLNAGRGRSGI